MINLSARGNTTLLKIMFGVLVLLVSFLCFKSTNLMMASIQFYGAQNYITQWQVSGREPEAEDIENAQQYAFKALTLHSDFALYSDALSTVLQWKALQANNSELKNTALNEAEMFNLLSTKHRPSWPVTWANLAYIKWLKGEFDEDFTRYITNADSLGSTTPEVHLSLATIGLGMSRINIRDFLTHKALFRKHIVLGLTHPRSKKNIAIRIDNTQTKPMVCGWLMQAKSLLVNQLKCG